MTYITIISVCVCVCLCVSLEKLKDPQIKQFNVHVYI